MVLIVFKLFYVIIMVAFDEELTSGITECMNSTYVVMENETFA